MSFIETLDLVLNQNQNASLAIPMENYMKNNFSFLGIKAALRRELMKQCCAQYPADIKTNFRAICQELYLKKEREYHLIAIDIFMKEVKSNYLVDDIYIIENMIISNSWWDSVDVVAKYLVGGYLVQFPEKKLSLIERFSNSDNRWLIRTAIIFQLSYKEKTDFDLLKSECEKHKTSKEFFIQKAIGWALRDYSRFNPSAVLNYVENTNLKPLSKREAIRNIK